MWDDFGLATATSWNDRSAGPDLDQLIDPDRDGERPLRYTQDLMKKHIRMQGSHEQQRGGARVLHVHHASLAGAAEVLADDSKASARRRVSRAGIERDDERRLGATVHVDREVGPDGGLNDGDELLGKISENLAGVGARVYGRQLGDDRRQLDVPALHGHREQFLFRAAAA